MNLKLISKNNMGIVATLILVILLSQSRLFNFLIDTALGRAVLILFILVISYTNKILGIVAVLFIIILFNQSGMGYLEGFTSTTDETNQIIKDKLKLKDKELQIKQKKLQMKLNKNNTTESSDVSRKKTETFVGREGFNMIDREGTMLRGKRSNEVPVFNNARNQTDDDIEPTDKSTFTSGYSML